MRNGVLFYDLGTALLKAGQADEAFEVLLRAERYLGYNPDVKRNLRGYTEVSPAMKQAVLEMFPYKKYLR